MYLDHRVTAKITHILEQIDMSEDLYSSSNKTGSWAYLSNGWV